MQYLGSIMIGIGWLKTTGIDHFCLVIKRNMGSKIILMGYYTIPGN